MIGKLYLFLLFFLACDPKLMPSFPQHRNLKSSKDNTNNSSSNSDLPAISDLLGTLIKKRRAE